MMKKEKVIIIGAGPAGLSAAYELLKRSNDYEVVILEASNEIGGISKTVSYKGNRIDIGGHRFFTKDERINKLWNEIMPMQSAPAIDDIILKRNVKLDNNGLDPEKENEVFLRRQRCSRILYLHKFFDYPISLKMRTFLNMGFTRTFKAGCGYLFRKRHRLKDDNLENFYINRFGKPLYKMFFEKYTEKVWGVSPKEIDASWGGQRVKGLSLKSAIVNALKKPFRKDKNKTETSLIEEFIYPKKGPGQLYEIMASKITSMGGSIIQNEEVNKVIIKDNRIVSVSTTTNKVYEGDYFFSSMPIKDLVLSIEDKNLSKEVYEVATNLIYRDFMTVGLLVNKLKIKNKTKIKTINNIVPDTWIYIQEEDVKVGRLQIFNNWSPYMVSNFKEYVWMGLEYFVNEGDENWISKDEDFINFAIKEMIKINILEKEEDVLDSTLVRVKKAYPAYFGTYKDFDVVKSYLNTIENLYCVGRNGQHRYNNMDHSMLTALIGVDHLLNQDFDKEKIWDVNVEESYHEEKK